MRVWILFCRIDDVCVIGVFDSQSAAESAKVKANLERDIPLSYLWIETWEVESE